MQPNRPETTRVALVSLLISTHALPALSYRVPGYLGCEVRVGTAVAAPLSGYSTLGVVVDFAEEEGDHSLVEIRGVIDELSLPEPIVQTCRWAVRETAISLPAALRAALPLGLSANSYKVVKPDPGWPWKTGALVRRVTLKRSLGGEGLIRAESEGRLRFSPVMERPRPEEWVMIGDGSSPNPKRAPRQNALYSVLAEHPDGCELSRLLKETGTTRQTLRQLVRKGSIYIELRDQAPPLLQGGGRPFPAVPEGVLKNCRQVAGMGGVWLLRLAHREQFDAAAAFTREAVNRRRQVLVLAPEIKMANDLARYLAEILPEENTVATYHAKMGRHRVTVYEAAKSGAIDVVVGTRAAALMPFERLGAICVVDEPNESHRAGPGHEGIPIHVRELVAQRARHEGAGVLCLSSFPSLQIYAPESGVKKLAMVESAAHAAWPSVRVLDMRGSGASLSSTLIDECAHTSGYGGRVGVLVNRLGVAKGVICSRCGDVRACPVCDLPMALHALNSPGMTGGYLFCNSCGSQETWDGHCVSCGSERMLYTGLAARGVRDELSAVLGIPVGLVTAGVSELEDADVVVGTARSIIERDWDLVAIPDADSLLLGAGVRSVERGARMLYRAAEASLRRLVVQTRLPEHYALQTTLHGDYVGFARAELYRLKSAGYPPYGHVAVLTFEGSAEAVNRAVESGLSRSIGPEVNVLEPVQIPGPRSSRFPVWRVLLRARNRSPVASVASEIARIVARRQDKERIRVSIDIDPEEA